MTTSQTIPSSDCQLEKKHVRYLFHDMNNNLGAICLTLEEIKNSLQSRPDCAADVEALHAAQLTITRTTQAMRELLRREQQAPGDHETLIQTVDLHSLLRDIVGQFSTEARRKGITLALDVPPHAAVESSYHLIGLILQNLLDNALKYSDGGTVTLRAQERSQHDLPQWLLSVTDEGPGIPPDRLLKLFNTFEHASNGSSAHAGNGGPKGFGIGLAITSDAARQLGAQLRATSRLGLGTTFYLLLPADPSRSATPANGESLH